jgi:histidyl-tRNA synthetase
MSTKDAKKEAKQPVELVSPKGMRDLIGGDFYAFQGFFERAQEVAVYYGFKPIETPILEHEDLFTTSNSGSDAVDKEMYALKTKGGDRLALRPELTASVMRSYIEHGMQSLPQPILLYYYGPVFRHDKPQKGRYRQFYTFGVEALGDEKSIIDALVIKTAKAILDEAGAKDIVVDINSIGCKECRKEYLKKLVAYYKKYQKDLPQIDKDRLAENPLRILDSKEEKTIEINEAAPDIASHLCVDCKNHFKEVLHYLDEMEIVYNVNKCLVRGLTYYSRTTFEFLQENEEGKQIALGGGGRYDYLAKQMGNKKDIPAVGFGFGVDRIVEAPWYKPIAPRFMKKPKYAFIQVGQDARLKSLTIIELLRKNHIPIVQYISKDSLSTQLALAEKENVRYALIFGQREAIDKSVIVRDMETRSQESVKIEKILEYLKTLK